MVQVAEPRGSETAGLLWGVRQLSPVTPRLFELRARGEERVVRPGQGPADFPLLLKGAMLQRGFK